MTQKLSLSVKKMLINKIKDKYKKAKKKDKAFIIDDVVELTNYKRKYAIHQLNNIKKVINRNKRNGNNKKYTEEIKEALVKVWYASNRICSKRLAGFLPEMVQIMHDKNHLNLEDKNKKLLATISASSIDRLLKTERALKKRRGKSSTNSVSLLQHKIAVKTFNSEEEKLPGKFEVDLVAHCGTTTDGSFLNTLVMTDFCSQWTEFFPLITKSANEVIAALKEAQTTIPFSILGIDTDNGSEFINNALYDFCKKQDIEFTRSRPYKKNDQAHVEEKNGSIIRKVTGYNRFEGFAAEQSLYNLYKKLRLYINYFQPSLKLKSRIRDGGKVTKIYDEAKTPYRRLLNSNISEKIKNNLAMEYDSLDPVNLLSQVQELQKEFMKHAWEKEKKLQEDYDKKIQEIKNDCKEIKKAVADGDMQLLENEAMNLKNINDYNPKKSLKNIENNFKNIKLESYKFTRKPRKKSPLKKDELIKNDVFKEVWNDDVVIELNNNNGIAATEILNKLICKYPKKFHVNQIRTFQRRVAQWRELKRNESRREN
ncbi:MAG: transposase family protein [Pelagibacterales bacterium]|nr:transposase family protein [Pelagibacterales bacterium]